MALIDAFSEDLLHYIVSYFEHDVDAMRALPFVCHTLYRTTSGLPLRHIKKLKDRRAAIKIFY